MKTNRTHFAVDSFFLNITMSVVVAAGGHVEISEAGTAVTFAAAISNPTNPATPIATTLTATITESSGDLNREP